MSRRNRYHRARIPSYAPPVVGRRELRGLDPKKVVDPERVVTGLVALEEGRHLDALTAFDALDRKHPGHPLASYLAGLVYHLNGQQAHAAWLFSRAAHGLPGWHLIPYNLGVCLQHMGQYANAEAQYREALALRPGFLSAEVNLAAVLGAQGRQAEAEVLHTAILDAHPTDPEARYNRATHLLVRGEWDTGFTEYEERYHMPAHAALHPVPQDRPRWVLGNLPGKSLLVHYEQGLGDTLMAAGYHAEIARRVGTVHWHVQAPLKSLFVAQGWNVTADPDPPPATDYVVATMSLPKVTGVLPSRFPAGGRHAYLAPRHDGAPPDVRRVGYRHAGSAAHLNDRQRSTTLEQWAPLFRVPGIEWVDLTPTHGMDFYALALTLLDLDLVVTVDTAVLHLAGALGVPCWALLATPPDWRWGLTGDRTPWYQSVRLFRQPVAGEWDSVFQQVRGALTQQTRRAA